MLKDKLEKKSFITNRTEQEAYLIYNRVDIFYYVFTQWDGNTPGNDLSHQRQKKICHQYHEKLIMGLELKLLEKGIVITYCCPHGHKD